MSPLNEAGPSALAAVRAGTKMGITRICIPAGWGRIFASSAAGVAFTVRCANRREQNNSCRAGVRDAARNTPLSSIRNQNDLEVAVVWTALHLNCTRSQGRHAKSPDRIGRAARTMGQWTPTRTGGQLHGYVGGRRARERHILGAGRAAADRGKHQGDGKKTDQRSFHHGRANGDSFAARSDKTSI
jgi:hypothetical protein